MKAYSVDPRERVVAAVERGTPMAEVAEAFGVGLASVKRWVRRRRRDPDDELRPRTPPGQLPIIGPDRHAELWKQLESNPTATAEEHARLWNETQAGMDEKKGQWEAPSGTRMRGFCTGSG